MSSLKTHKRSLNPNPSTDLRSIAEVDRNKGLSTYTHITTNTVYTTGLWLSV